MQKTKKIHHKSNTKHGKKRKVRTIKHPKKNTGGVGNGFLDDSARITEADNKYKADNASISTPTSWFSGMGTLPFSRVNFNNQPTPVTPVSSNVDFNYQPIGNDKPPEGFVKEKVDNFESYASNNNTKNRPVSVESDLTTKSLRGSADAVIAANRLSDGHLNTDPDGTWTDAGKNSLRGSADAVIAANRLSDGPGGGPVGPKSMPPFNRGDAFRGPIDDNGYVVPQVGPDANDTTGNVNPQSTLGDQVGDPLRGSLTEVDASAPGSTLTNGLPPGFRTTVDEQSGRLIYHNDNDRTSSWYPPAEAMPSVVPELGTIYIVRYRNSNGAISEKEVFKHIDTNPGKYTRYVFDNDNIPRECKLDIYDIGEAIKKNYEPYCEEISLAPLGNT